MSESSAARDRAQALAIAFVITIAARAIPAWSDLIVLWRDQLGGSNNLPYELFHDLVLLVLGLCLALSAPRQSGLVIGAIRQHWRGTAIVCGLPLVLCVSVYPFLEERPFAGSHWTMWVVSPLAQDLVFLGFLYGYLERSFGRHALVLTAAFFALWHVPNAMGGMSWGYLAFQVCYTAAGLILVGLSRRWTGSVLYATLTHSAVNFVAWAVG